MGREYINTASLADTLEVLAQKREQARLVAGATDLLLEMERGQRKGIETLVDITRIGGLDNIEQDEQGWIHLGALVTHNHVIASSILREQAMPLVQAAWQVGSPQIRNRGTVVGNLVTASPANDTIPALMALNAEVELHSKQGIRVVALAEFYTGVRKTVLRSDEMIVDVRFLGLKPNQHGCFLKVALRQAQAISVVNAACILDMDGPHIRSAVITLGAVAPTVIHAAQAEQFLAGKLPEKDLLAAAAQLAAQAARPIKDLRGSAEYRTEMVAVVCRRALEQAAGLRINVEVPVHPVLLWGHASSPVVLQTSRFTAAQQPIETTINGRPFVFHTGHEKSLLRLLREEGGLTGTKEGCAEGECGACTVYLDGKAVMSCLVPAPRAHGAQIVTIEGLSSDGSHSQNGGFLHPLQKSFIEAGAVQCGYCTPGLIMSGAKLLEEKARPDPGEIRQAITGNLCRCTGYYKIIQAIEMAAIQGGK